MSRGGQREGAGRPRGSGSFGEPTKAVRVPLSQVDGLMRFIRHRGYRLPLYQCAVSAGFPTPTDSDMDQEIDINDLLIRHPEATFFVRVSGFSMINAGIHHDDILVVDRSLEPAPEKIVIAAVNGELTVKRLRRNGERIRLVAENDSYLPIDITDDMEFHIWGVVTNVIHAV